jgi:hypothetical protein
VAIANCPQPNVGTGNDALSSLTVSAAGDPVDQSNNLCGKDTGRHLELLDHISLAETNVPYTKTHAGVTGPNSRLLFCQQNCLPVATLCDSFIAHKLQA